ncbi:MAG: OmpH family outer membrane protein [Alphaproteobacteria bacterium]|nr:OmpH family outer membrane protein [Alphaproteobacteria bacterium]
MTLRFLSGVCLTLLLCLSGTAMAAEAKAPAANLTPSIDDPVIAVLDVQQVLRRAAAAKGIRLAMEARRKAFEAEIAAERQQIRDEELQLRKQSTILSPEASNEKRRLLENRMSDFRRKVEQRRGILNRAFTSATRVLRKEMATVLAELMKERKITLTLARKAVLVFDQRLSVTEDVLKRLDKRLPTVKVNFKRSTAN